MVLRETGAGWLAAMMRAERAPERAPEPERPEALEPWMFHREVLEPPRRD